MDKLGSKINHLIRNHAKGYFLATCIGKDDCKAKCGFKSGNPIKSCNCADGELWTKPSRPGRPGKPGAGKPGKPGRPGHHGPPKKKPCGGLRNIASCTCNGGQFSPI